MICLFWLLHACSVKHDGSSLIQDLLIGETPLFACFKMIGPRDNSKHYILKAVHDASRWQFEIAIPHEPTKLFSNSTSDCTEHRAESREQARRKKKSKWSAQRLAAQPAHHIKMLQCWILGKIHDSTEPWIHPSLPLISYIMCHRHRIGIA